MMCGCHRIVLGVAATVTLLSSPCGPLAAEKSSPGSQPARRSPEWLKQATIYQVWPRSFSREGTLQGRNRQVALHRRSWREHCLFDADQPDVDRSAAGALEPENALGRPRPGRAPSARPYRIADYDAIDPEFRTERIYASSSTRLTGWS